MAEIEKFMEKDIICPYCNWKDRDSWENPMSHDGDCEEYECPECEKKFIVQMNICVTYTTTGLCKENGVKHNWEHFDHERSDGNGRCIGKRCLTCDEYVFDETDDKESD